MANTYSAGTLAVTNGSKAVTITGGLSISINMKPGDFIAIEGGLPNAIASLTDNTHFQLSRDFDGATDAAASYIVIHMPTGWGDRTELNEQTAEVIRLLGVDIPFTQGQLDAANAAAGTATTKAAEANASKVAAAQSEINANTAAGTAIAKAAEVSGAYDVVVPVRNETLAARDTTILARDASFALGPKYTTEALGRAAVADNASFLVVGSGDIAAIEYRRVDANTSVQLASYPSAAVVDAIKKAAVGSVQAPVVTIGGRPVQPITLSFDLYVLTGTYVDTGETYDALAPSVTRLASLSAFTFNLPPIQFNGRTLQPLEYSFDLYITRGIFLDTGEVYQPTLSGGASDSSRLTVVVTASRLRIYGLAANGLTSGKYICWQFSNTPNAGINSDVWRLDGAYEATKGSGGFILGQAITNPGEVENAIMINGRSDFIGGNAHGNEIRFSNLMLVDGIERSLTTPATYSCRRLNLFQASHMYLPSASADGKVYTPIGTNVADSYKRWQFERPGEVELTQQVKWLAVHTLSITYLTMVPAWRSIDGVQITDKAIISPLWDTQDVGVTPFSQIYTLADEIMLSGPSGYSVMARILEGWDKPNRNSRVSNSPDPNYNKIYFDFTGTGYVTSIGEVMRARSIIRIDSVN